MHLTPDELAQYNKDGFLLYDKRILSDADIQGVNEHVQKVCRGETSHPRFLMMTETGRSPEDDPVTPENPIRKVQSMSYCSPEIAALARDPRIVDVVESILGPDIKLYSEEYFFKNPARNGKPWMPYRWHQDAPADLFAPTEHYVTCWIALNRATPENGCMQFIPGSHHFGSLPATHYGTFIKHPAVPKPVFAPREVGYAVFHHGLNFHTSEPNRSTQPRRAIAFHYISAKTIYFTPEDPVLRKIVQQGNMGTDYRFLPIRGREFANCV